MVATGEARPSEATAGVPEPTVDEPQAIGAHGPVTDDPAQPPPGAADRPAEKTGGGGPIRRYRWLALGLGLVVAAAAAAIIVFTGGGSTPGQGPGDRLRPLSGDDRIQVPRFALELTPRRTGIARGQQAEADLGGRDVDRRRVAGLEHPQRMNRVSQHLAGPLNPGPTVTRSDGGRTRIVVPHSLHPTTVYRRRLRRQAR